MKVNIDPYSGFCFGVTRVVETAEEVLRAEGHLYCLGEIVHNNKEIERLEKIGLEIITHEEFMRLSNCKVLIRAHGEPPETYQHALLHGIEIIDGTCPIVLRLQSRIEDDFTENSKKGVQIVIFGRKNHAEVRGLAGQTGYKTIIIESETDLDRIDYSRPVHLYAQTTMDHDHFAEIRESILNRLGSRASEEGMMVCTNSICAQVSGRIERLKKFSHENDVVVFVSYIGSSNGKLLFTQCKTVNENTYFVSGVADVREEWLKGAGTVGITGATSTPRWLLEEIASHIEKLYI